MRWLDRYPLVYILLEQSPAFLTDSIKPWLPDYILPGFFIDSVFKYGKTATV